MRLFSRKVPSRVLAALRLRQAASRREGHGYAPVFGSTARRRSLLYLLGHHRTFRGMETPSQWQLLCQLAVVHFTAL